jgi:hypothetical protein
MKATLEFKLPEEQSDFDLANKAGSYHAAIHEIMENIFRRARKYGQLDGTELNVEELDTIQGIEDRILDILDRYKIDWVE